MKNIYLNKFINTAYNISFLSSKHIVYLLKVLICFPSQQLFETRVNKAIAS